MAHHVAELMQQSENADTPRARRKARDQAAETILKIWERRATLPKRVNPLSEYGPVLEVVRHLNPTENAFGFYPFRGLMQRDELAAKLFDHLCRLTIILLLMKLPQIPQPSDDDQVAQEHLEETERNLLIQLRSWSGLVPKAPAGTHEARRSRKPRGTGQQQLTDIALGLVEQTSQILTDLQADLRNDTA